MSDVTRHLTPSDERRVVTSPPCVVQLYGGTIGRRFELTARELVVGRDADCDIAIDLTTVSRRHARLFLSFGDAMVEDLGSTNGTLVNDVEIERVTRLQNGDLVKFGSAVFKFIEGGDVEALYHEEIHRLAITDGLTGAANKRAFVEFLTREVTRAKRHGRPLSLAMFDLDHFKKVNDEHGHLAGDHVLRAVTNALHAIVRGDELLARYGGEEFAIVLPETSGSGVATFAERVRAEIEKLHIEWEGAPIPVTVSIGATELRSDDTVDSLIARADANLYEAKRSGRNRVVA